MPDLKMITYCNIREALPACLRVLCGHTRAFFFACLGGGGLYAGAPPISIPDEQGKIAFGRSSTEDSAVRPFDAWCRYVDCFVRYIRGYDFST